MKLLPLNSSDDDLIRYVDEWAAYLENEDYRAAEISHAGLSTGALDTVVYSGLEATVPTYYEILESYLPK